MSRLLCVLFAGVIVAGCAGRGGGGRGSGDGDEDTGPGGGDDGGVGVDVPRLPPPSEESCTKMDLLVIIDDSGSMAEEQGNLAMNFPRFIEILDAYRTEGGGELDYRIGVTTTGRPTTVEISFPPMFPTAPMTMMEDGPNGALLMPPSCGMTRRWIDRRDPDVAGTFSCLANVGTEGSSIEMPLLMAQRAV